MRKLSNAIKCSAPNCDRPNQAAGYCTMHYQRARKGKDLSAPALVSFSYKDHPECFHPGCDRLRAKDGKFCNLHYRRNRLGLPMDKLPRHEIPEEDRWHVNSKGYVERHIKGSNPRTTELQHRVVMKQKLGRELFPHENVHHINGHRADNRQENLELWSTSQPSGQRVEDKMKWAKEFIEQYGGVIK